jgi:hypothetical protein
MNTVEIEVTARDGVTKMTYTLNVNRQMSANNFLEFLAIDQGALTPDFDKYIMYYEVTVPNSVNIVTIDAEPEASTSTVFGTGMHALQGGDNTIDVTVISATGVERTYHVLIKREKSSVNTLSNLVVRNGVTTLPLSPAFDPAITTYDVAGVIGQTSVELVAIRTSLLATVAGDGVHAVKVGPNQYKITVVAENGSTNVYTINLTRPASTNVNLAALIPSVGTLDPVFDPAVTVYEINFSEPHSIISFVATPEYPVATVAGNGITSLGSSADVIIVTVTAEDGVTTKDYIITVNQYRHDEARLASLSVDGQTLAPVFSSDTYAYSITIPSDKLTFSPSEITAVPKDIAATLSMSPALDFSANPSVAVTKNFTILVLAEDGFTTQTYTIAVTRLPAFADKITSSIDEVNRDDSGFEYVIGILPETTLGDFKDELDNPNEYLHIFERTGVTEITDNAAFVGTGMIVKLIIGGTVHDELTIIVRGDLDGDGIVNVTDIGKLDSYLLGNFSLQGPQILAAKVNLSDSSINVSDASKLDSYLLGTFKGKDLNE